MIKFNVLIFSIFLCACAANRNASTDKQSQKPITNVSNESTDVVVEEIAMSIEAEPTTLVANSITFDAVKNIQFNQKYGISNSINDQYDLSWEKNSNDKYSRQGIVDKNGNVILPHIFSKKSNGNTTSELVLGIGNTSGLYNVNDLRWSIPLMYEDLSHLANNLYIGKKDGKWGVIDNNNVVIVPFEWSQLQRISNLDNYVSVTKDQLSGVFSIVEKKLTVPCIYSSVRKLDRQNSFQVKQGSRTNIVDISNVPMFKRWYEELRPSTINPDYYIVRESNRFGVIDSYEKVIVPIDYMEFSENPYSDGSYLARNKEGKYGFMLIDGRVTLPFKYDNVRKGYNSNIVSIQDGKCGLVQVNAGAPFEIVTCEFDNILEASKIFIVEKGGKFGLLNQFGKQMTSMDYESMEAFKEGYYDNVAIYIAKKGNHSQLINEQGRVISEGDLSEITPLYRRNQYSYSAQRFTYLKAKTKQGKYGVMDKVGKMIVAPQFEDIMSEDDNLMIVKSNKKCGMYSLLGQKLIVGYEYDLITRSNNSYMGFAGNDIDFLNVKSDQVTKISTIK
jgi:hypothetical protein